MALCRGAIFRFLENSYLIFFFSRYPRLRSHMKKVFDDRSSWALCFRKNLPVRGNHTNNYCEAAMRVLKDKVMMRTKAFNAPQLLHFLTTRMEKYGTNELIIR